MSPLPDKKDNEFSFVWCIEFPASTLSRGHYPDLTNEDPLIQEVLITVGVINRPGVAGAVLQTPLSLIN